MDVLRIEAGRRVRAAVDKVSIRAAVYAYAAAGIAGAADRLQRTYLNWQLTPRST